MEDLEYNEDKIIELIESVNKKLKPNKQWNTDYDALQEVYQELNTHYLNSDGTSADVELISHDTLSGHTETYEYDWENTWK